MKSKISAFMHVEMVHPDPRAAGAFLAEIFGAEQVELNLSNFVERTMPGVECVHMRMGDVVFQIVKPTANLPSWHAQLTERGPGVHNVSLQVDDIESVRDALLSKGCVMLAAHEVDFSTAGMPCKGTLKAYVIDAHEQAGVRLELLPSELGYVPIAKIDRQDRA